MIRLILMFPYKILGLLLFKKSLKYNLWNWTIYENANVFCGQICTSRNTQTDSFDIVWFFYSMNASLFIVNLHVINNLFANISVTRQPLLTITCSVLATFELFYFPVGQNFYFTLTDTV